MNRLRILVVDDHEVVRRGIRALLETRSEWEICGEAATGSETLEKVKKLRPDLVVLDISMPEGSGLEVMREIQKVHPQTEILILTMHDSGPMASDVLAAGARGLVLKSDGACDLVLAVEALSQHKPFLSSRVTEMILRAYAKSAEAGPSPSDLTTREREIINWLARGKSNKEVAAALGISAKTVEAHRANIMRKLNLRSIRDLILFAIRNKIIEI